MQFYNLPAIRSMLNRPKLLYNHDLCWVDGRHRLPHLWQLCSLEISGGQYRLHSWHLVQIRIPRVARVCSFLITTALTLCIDSMMYIHSVSLRWALYDEGRLEYNTNVWLYKLADLGS